jgi:hypothetical protein
MQDFPAAHSMDTTWFAIDADGCVGIFNSSEGGAVPRNLPRLSEIEAIPIECSSELFDVLLKNQQGLFLYNSSVRIEPVLEQRSIELETEWKLLSVDALVEGIRFHEQYALQKHNYERDWNMINNMVLQLSNEQVIENLKSQAEIIIRFADEKILIYVDKCNLEWLKKAIESEIVLAGAGDMYLEDNLSWLGWYEYDCGEQYAAPYQRSYPIKDPLLFSDLPPEIVNHIRVTRLQNIRFSETDKIQPIEHIPCYTWGNHEGWIDPNGVEHDRFPEYLNLDRTNN